MEETVTEIEEEIPGRIPEETPGGVLSRTFEEILVEATGRISGENFGWIPEGTFGRISTGTPWKVSEKKLLYVLEKITKRNHTSSPREIQDTFSGNSQKVSFDESLKYLWTNSNRLHMRITLDCPWEEPLHQNTS